MKWNPFKKKISNGKPARRSYAMGVMDRLSSDFSTGSLTADQAVYGSIHAMRNRARVLERDNSYVRKFLAMAKTSIIGGKGIRLRSVAGDYVRKGGKTVFQSDKIDQNQLESAYLDFSKAWNFDVAGKLDRRRFAQIGMQRVLVDGEFIARKRRGRGDHGLQLQMIDAELLDHTLNRRAGTAQNEIRMGIEMDAMGKPITYYFLPEAPPQWTGTSALSSKHTGVPADQIVHLFIQERPGQSRGVTWLAPTGLRARMLDKIEEAVTIGWRMGASKMGFFKANENYSAPVDTDGKPVEMFGNVPQSTEPGEFWELPEGLDFQQFDPGYPDASFEEVKKSIIREFASGFGVSYPELGNDFSGVSYSAGQIGVQSDISFWSDLQQFWVDGFEEPVFLEWLPLAITIGALELPASKIKKFKAVKFQPPRRKHIDPLKTHNAQRVALGDMSRSIFDITAENGADFEDIVDDTRRAIELLEDNGLPIPESWAAGCEFAPDPPEPAEA